MDTKVYVLKEDNESLKRYNLKNLDRLNVEQLRTLKLKMEHNLKQIRDRKESIREDQVLYILCLERRKIQ